MWQFNSIIYLILLVSLDEGTLKQGTGKISELIGQNVHILDATKLSAFNGRNFWNYVSTSKVPPCIVGIFNEKESLANGTAEWNVQLPWELNLQVFIYGYDEDNIEDFKRQILVMKLHCVEIHFLLFVSTNTATEILRQIKQRKMESPKQKWILMASVGIKELPSDISTGQEIRILEQHDRGIQSLAILRIYRTNIGKGIAHKMEPLASWKDDSNYSQPEELIRIPKTPVNLKGRILNVTVVDDWPFYGISKVNGEVVSSGIDANIVKSLSQSFNFITQVVSPEDGNWGNPTTNGTITGMIGMVAREEADLAIDEITITAERETVVDFSYPYYFEPTVILTLEPQQASKAWAVFTPYSKVMWVTLASSIVFYGCLLWFVRHSLLLSQERRANESPLSYVLYSLQSITGQDATLKIISWPFRFMFIAFSIVGLLIRVLYSGILTSVLVAPSYEKPIDSLEDLVQDSHLHFVIRKGTTLQELLETSPSGIYHQLYNKLIHSPISYTSTSEEYLKLIQKNGYATIAAKLGVEISTTEINHELFHLSRESFYPQSYGMAMNRGFEFIAEFNTHLTKLFEGGIIDKWKNEQVNIARFKSNSRNSTNSDSRNDKGPRTLTLTHLQGAFFLYMIGILVSIVIFVFELCFKKIMGLVT